MEKSALIQQKRIIDFDPTICGAQNGSILLFSPILFIEDGVLYLPEKVRMPDGSIDENVVFDPVAFTRILNEWEGESISLCAGKNYVMPIFNRLNGYYTEWQKNYYLHIPKVTHITLYDDSIEEGLASGLIASITSNNGILYLDDEITYVPDHNVYAERLPLIPILGNEDACSEKCGMDLFGGIYSLDGSSFIRWTGSESVHSSYQIRHGVRVIREKAFQKWQNIKNVSIPESVIEIGDRAFYECQSLVTFNLPSNLQRIGDMAFNTTSIKEVVIPKSVAYIGDKCFGNCWELASIEVEQGNKFYASESGVLFNSDKTVLLCVPTLLFPDSEQNVKDVKDCSEEMGEIYIGPSRKEYTIPESVKVIADGALLRCPFKILNITQNVVSMGDTPLEMNYLSKIRVHPDNKRYVVVGSFLIDKYTNAIVFFFGSDKEPSIPEGFEMIASQAFNRSLMKDIVIPEGVKYIGEHALGCSTPRSIHFPKSICYFRDGFYRDYYNYDDFKIIVPNGMLEKYRRLLGEYSWFVKRYMEEEKDETVPIKYHYDGKVSEMDLTYAIADEYGVLYSSDGKRLLNFPNDFFLGTSFYRVKDGTEVICEDAYSFSINAIHFPPSLKYICRNGFWCSRIVFEGDNIDIEDNTFELPLDTTIYIPCGTWANFFKNIEIGRWKDEDDEDIDEDDIRFNLIELSRPNVYKYLKEQKEIFLGILSQHQLISSYSIASLDGTYENRFICYKDNGKVLCFNEYYKCYYKHILHLSALGYKKRDITNLLGISIDEVKNNREALAQYLGRTLASPLRFSWIEDCVDEDTGEVVPFKRYEIVLEAGHTLEEKDINMMLENKRLVKEPIRFLHESYNHDYLSFIRFVDPNDDDTWKLDEDHRNLLIQSMFPYMKPEDVSKEEKLTLAYNIVTINKGLCEHGGYLDEILLPLKFNGMKADAIVEETEAKLRDLISTFYDDKINRIMACETDSQVVAEFKDDREILDELTIYLEANGIKSQIVESYVNHVFKFFTRDDDLW